MIVLASMSKYNELLFIRSIGLSINKIFLYSSSYVVLFTILIFILGELLAPKIELLAQNKKTLALSQGNAISTFLGTWVRNKNKFIHVKMIKDHNTLNDVHIYTLDDEFKVLNSTFAETVKLISDQRCKNTDKDCNNLWELSNVTITDFSYEPKDTSTGYDAVEVNDLNIKSNIIKQQEILKLEEKNLLDMNILRASNVKHLERLSIINLFRIIRERVANNLSVIEYKIAYWKKIIQPFSIIIMGYLAFPLVISRFKRYSTSTYLLLGVILGIVFYLLNAVLIPLATVLGLPPSLGIIMPPLIFLSIGIYFTVKN